MESKALVYSNWDDLVFENRNKSYGAFVLRKSYNDKVLLGLGVSVVILVLLLFTSGHSEKPIEKQTIDVISCSFDFERKPLFKKKILIQKPKSPKPKINNQTALPPLVVDTPVEDAPVEEDLQPEPFNENAVVEGDETLSMSITIPESSLLDKTISCPVGPVIEPSYEGGSEAMAHFFQKELNYPSTPKRLGIEGTVFVSFVINGDGAVRDVVVVRGIHPDCDKEAIRVVSLLPGWNGGRQGGSPVSVRMILPIKFKLN